MFSHWTVVLLLGVLFGGFSSLLEESFDDLVSAWGAVLF